MKNQHEPIFFTPPRDKLNRQLYKGASDGGAGAREAANEARKAAAMKQISEIFGESSPTANVIDKNKYYKSSPTASANNPLVPGINSTGVTGIPGVTGMSGINGITNQVQPATRRVFDQAGYDSAVKAESDRVAALGDRAAVRDKSYQDIADNVFSFQKDNVDRQHADEARNLKFELARRGQLGGSNDIDQNKLLGTLYDRTLLNAKNEADSSATSARTADQSTKLSLINSINAGMDGASAVSSANASLANNLNDAKQSGLGQTVSNLMDDANLISHSSGITTLSPTGASYIPNTRSALSPVAGGNTYKGNLRGN